MDKPSVALLAANFPQDLATVRQIFQEYADSTGIDLHFQNFAAELAHLPGEYAPPRGQLLLATVDGGQQQLPARRRVFAGQVGQLGREILKMQVNARAVSVFLEDLPNSGQILRKIRCQQGHRRLVHRRSAKTTEPSV